MGEPSQPIPSAGACEQDEMNHTLLHLSSSWLTCGLMFYTDKYSDEGRDDDEEEEEDHWDNSHHHPNNESSVHPTRTLRRRWKDCRGEEGNGLTSTRMATDCYKHRL